MSAQWPDLTEMCIEGAVKVAVQVCNGQGQWVTGYINLDEISGRLAAPVGKCRCRTEPPTKAITLVLELVQKQVLPPVDGSTLLDAMFR